MFSVLYFYRIPKNKIESFILIQEKSSEIYKKYGAIEDWTFKPNNTNKKYNCSAFEEEISIAADEELFFSISIFNSKEEHDRIMSKLDIDEEISSLYEEFSHLINLSKVIRGEFNKII